MPNKVRGYRGLAVSNAVAGTISEESRPAGFLALMRNRNYALLWSGQLISELGNRFHWIAVSLWIYSLYHSAAAVSLAIASMFVGGLLVGLWAGVLVDRLNRKAILIVSDLARAVLVALIPWLLGVSVWLAYADLAIISMATAFFRPAMFAIIPQVVRQRNLLPANSFFSAMDTGTEVVGPAIAGILAYAYGYASLLYIDATTYLVSAVCVLAMSTPASISGVARDFNLRTVWSGVIEGIRYVRKDRLQWGLFILIFPAVLVGSGLNALQTPLAKGVVGITDVEFGTFNSVWGAGFVTASLVLGWFGGKVRKSLIILAGYFLMFTSAALMGLSTSFQALLLTGFAVGFANTLHYVGRTTVLMEHTPQEVIGRVISTRQVALSSVRILAPLIFGVLADRVGVRQAIVTMAVLGAAGTALTVTFYPILRRFDAGGDDTGERSFAIWRFISGPADPSFDEAQQRKLNVITTGLVLLGALGLLYRVPYGTLWLLLVIFTMAFLGSLWRRRGWLP